MSTIDKPKIRLDEVTLMRSILAILIVLFHAFCCWDGRWKPFDGFEENPFYGWISRVAFAFTLEGFVLISGYLYAFQQITLKRNGGGKILILTKLKRLILPSILFTALYFALFLDYKGVPDLIYSLVQGRGHMWYLPMLFWCFMGGWLIEKINISDKWKLLVLAVVSIMTIVSLPLRIDKACQYMFYFYGGYVLYKESDKIREFVNSRWLTIGWIAYAIVFFLFRFLQAYVDELDGSLFSILANLCQLLYASLGALVFYATAVYYTQSHQLHSLTNEVARCSFGIYLFQQFILMILYYKTDFPVVVGNWLPWIGFVVTLVASLGLSYLLLKTKTGKYLIG